MLCMRTYRPSETGPFKRRTSLWCNHVGDLSFPYMTLITATTRLSRELQREYDREQGGGRSFDYRIIIRPVGLVVSIASVRLRPRATS